MDKQQQALPQGVHSRTQVTTLAARGERLMAAITDMLLMLLVAVPAAFMLDIPEILQKTGTIPIARIEQLLAINFAGFMAFHGYLLKYFGQTFGKRLMNIAIVDMHGQTPELHKLILVRYMPMWLVLALPFLIVIVPIIDSLPILNRHRRCLHDWIAQTRVVRIPQGPNKQLKRY